MKSKRGTEKVAVSWLEDRISQMARVFDNEADRISITFRKFEPAVQVAVAETMRLAARELRQQVDLSQKEHSTTDESEISAGMRAEAGMLHYERFQMECEAYVVHKDDCLAKPGPNHAGLPWRACVRLGDGTLHWAWCRTERQALGWIARWKRKLE